MKIKRKELTQIAKGVELYDAQKLKFFRLTLLLTKNVKLTKDEVDIFDQAKEKILPTEEVKKFHEQQRALAEKYWKADENKEWVMEEKHGQSVHVLTNKPELDGKLETMQKKAKPLFDRYNDAAEKAEALLDEEIEIPLQKITDVEHVKKLSPKTLAALAPIIEVAIPESLLEEKGDALTTLEVERILEFCEVEK